MTKLENLIQEDTILPFQLEHSDIRGRVARLNETLVNILSQHSYPDIVETLVAEAVLITALIGQTINLKWKLSLQIRGNGSIKLIATDYFAPDKKNGSGKIRAFASFDEKNLNHHEKKPFNELGKGYFAVLIDWKTNFPKIVNYIFQLLNSSYYLMLKLSLLPLLPEQKHSKSYHPLYLPIP